MKKLFLLFAALCCIMVTNAQLLSPDFNEIVYATTDGKPVNHQMSDIESNTYIDGKGVLSSNDVLTQIPYRAFEGCATLESINLPASVRRIDNAFNGCVALKRVICNSLEIPSPKDHPFNSCPNLTEIIVPERFVGYYKKYWDEVADKIKPDTELRDSVSAAIITLSDTLPKIMQDEAGSAYLDSMMVGDIKDIRTPVSMEYISTRSAAAINRMQAAVSVYKAAKKENLGTLATPQDGPAIEVTDQNDKVIRLYNPKKAKLREEKGK